MDPAVPRCPSCGAVHDYADQFCRFCKSPLTPEAIPSRRRRLVVGLVLGGLSLAGVGSYLGPALLRGFLFQTSVLNFSGYDANWTSSGITAESSSLLWSTDGTRLVLLVYEHGRYAVQVCDAHTGQRLFTCQHVEGRLTGCSWSPDGRYLAAGIVSGGSSQDETLGEGSTIQFWDAQSGKALFSYQAPRAPTHLIWSADSHFLATHNPQNFGRVGIHVEFINFALQVFQVG